MARTSISTGNFTFKTTLNLDEQYAKRSASDVFHTVIIGDFSGRGSRGEVDIQGLANRKVIEVDRDNLEQVFSQLKVRLRVPLCEGDLEFPEFDSLHPDYLLEHLDLFSKFTSLKHRLKKPEQFDALVAEMQALNLYTTETQGTDTGKVAVDSLKNELSNGMSIFDSILAEAQSQSQDNILSEIGDINSYIKKLVAPFAQKKADPRLPDMLSAVNEAIAQTLRGLMHHKAFQELEANWRGLDFLVRRIETDAQVKLFIIDATREEIIQDALANDDINESALYKRIVTSYQVAGKKHFSCLQVNLALSDHVDELSLAVNLAHMAATTGAIALMGGSELLAGCASLASQPDADDWAHQLPKDFSVAWQAFRESDLSRHIAFVAPRFLLRLPYGKKTSPIDSFDFSELPENKSHHYYAWGNSAHLVTLILANNFLQWGKNFNTRIASEIDGLPIHAYEHDMEKYGMDKNSMESYVKPCAEILITSSAVKQLESSGILVVRSIEGKAAVQVPALRTANNTGHIIFS